LRKANPDICGRRGLTHRPVIDKPAPDARDFSRGGDRRLIEFGAVAETPRMFISTGGATLQRSMLALNLIAGWAALTDAAPRWVQAHSSAVLPIGRNRPRA
jgi:hypothetical protein